MRNLWDRIMIALMVGVIGFCLMEIWNGTSELLRCGVGIGGAVLVILLKLNALQKAKQQTASNP